MRDTGLRKKAFGFLLLLAVLAVLAYVTHFHWKWAVQRCRRQLIASGERLAVADNAPRPLSAEMNSAELFLKACAGFGTNASVLDTNPPSAMRIVVPGRAGVGWARTEVHGDSGGANSWTEIEAALAEEAEAIKALRQIADRPAMDFGVPYEVSVEEPERLHSTLLRKAGMRLSAAVLCDLHRRDTAAATADLRALLALVKATQEQRLAIPQMTRCAIAHLGIATTWEFLQFPGITDDQLTRLQTDWMALGFSQPAEEALSMERALTEATFERIRSSTREYREWFHEAPPDRWSARLNTLAKEAIWRVWWSYPDELKALGGYQVLIECARSARTNYAFRTALADQRTRLADLGFDTSAKEYWWDAFLDKVGGHRRAVFSRSVLSLAGYLENVKRVEVAKQMIVTALALQRYHLHHGAYPASLPVLVPESLPATPRDAVDGKPLRYQLTGKTFLLYSVGDDGVDNGGDPSPVAAKDWPFPAWQKARDYVWPSPATDQEVQAYEKRLSFAPD